MATEWKSDAELFALCCRELYTPVVGDILDDLGFAHQFLPQPIQPLREEMKLAGRAMPVLMIDVFGKQKQPFGKLTEALDQLQPGEIYVATGGEMRCAYWGEILTATAKKRGAVGAVINGFHRDTPKVLEQNWPVFSRGRFAQDSAVRTQVVDYRCPIEVGGAGRAGRPGLRRSGRRGGGAETRWRPRSSKGPGQSARREAGAQGN